MEPVISVVALVRELGQCRRRDELFATDVEAIGERARDRHIQHKGMCCRERRRGVCSTSRNGRGYFVVVVVAAGIA
jgi:hypothetical protein